MIYWVCFIIFCYVAAWILYFICVFPCMYSEITFLRRSHLRRHKRKHTEQKGVCSLKFTKYIINILSFKNLWCNNCTFWALSAHNNFLKNQQPHSVHANSIQLFFQDMEKSIIYENVDEYPSHLILSYEYLRCCLVKKKLLATLVNSLKQVSTFGHFLSWFSCFYPIKLQSLA